MSAQRTAHYYSTTTQQESSLSLLELLLREHNMHAPLLVLVCCRWNYNGTYPYGYEPLGPASKTAEPFWMASQVHDVLVTNNNVTLD